MRVIEELFKLRRERKELLEEVADLETLIEEFTPFTASELKEMRDV